MALSRKDSAAEAERDQARQMALAADVFGVVGAVLLAATLVYDLLTIAPRSTLRRER